VFVEQNRLLMPEPIASKKGQVRLQQAIELLEKEEIVAVATESSFALCANGRSANAVGKLAQFKPDRASPVALAARDWDSASLIWQTGDPGLQQFCDRCWPGPVTVVAPAKKGVARGLLGEYGVGIRVPSSSTLIDVLAHIPLITATSANPPGYDPAYTFEELSHYFPDLRWYGVPDGNKLPSTVVAYTAGGVVLLRDGATPFSSLQCQS
jgi:L-threonylcarbamoyladenylate synthase